MKNTWFTEARYGLFIHYGLYSLLPACRLWDIPAGKGSFAARVD